MHEGTGGGGLASKVTLYVPPTTSGRLRSVTAPFSGDYVRLRRNWLWREARGRADKTVVFADIVNKANRSNGKVGGFEGGPPFTCVPRGTAPNDFAALTARSDLSPPFQLTRVH